MTSTYNGGRPSDALEYAKYQYLPAKYLKIKKNSLLLPVTLRSKLILIPNAHNWLPLKEFFLPIPVDKGKCHCGIILFLQKALSGETEVEIAQQFASGIPLEGIFIRNWPKKFGWRWEPKGLPLY